MREVMVVVLEQLVRYAPKSALPSHEIFRQVLQNGDCLSAITLKFHDQIFQSRVCGNCSFNIGRKIFTEAIRETLLAEDQLADTFVVEALTLNKVGDNLLDTPFLRRWLESSFIFFDSSQKLIQIADHLVVDSTNATSQLLRAVGNLRDRPFG